MSRRAWSRVTLAEPPCFVLVPSFDDGTPEAAEEVRAFLEAHKGVPVMLCRRVDARSERNKGKKLEQVSGTTPPKHQQEKHPCPSI